MTVTNSRSARPASADPGSVAVDKVKEAGATLASNARRVPGPARTAGAAAAGLAGGLLIGARVSSGRRGLALLPAPRSKVLGVPVGPRRHGVSATAKALAGGARQLGTAASRASHTADDIRMIREHLAAANRRSPIEIVLDALTHRRGAHRMEQ